MGVFLCLLFLLLGIANVRILLKELKANGWSLFTYSLVYLTIFFVVIPIVSLLFFNGALGFAYKIPNLTSDFGTLFFSFLVICVGFLSYYIGYFVTKGKRADDNTRIVYRTIRNQPLKNIIIYLTFILSLIGLFLYVYGFGSFENAVLNANLVRSGYYKNLEDGSDTFHTFFFRFIFLSIIPFLYYYVLDKNERLFKFKLIMSISLLKMVLLYLFLSSGRQAILDVFLIFIFSSLIINKNVINKKLIFFSVAALLALPFLDVFFVRSSSDRTYEFEFSNLLINEFGFPFYSLYYSIISEYNFSYFLDFYLGIYGKLLPSSWSPGIPQTNFINTYFVTGDIHLGYVPPGLFAQGYYSLGIIGVIIVSFFTGYIFKKIDLYFRALIFCDSGYTFFYTFAIVQSLAWVRTGLPANYFFNFTFMVFWVFLFSSLSVKSKRT